MPGAAEGSILVRRIENTFLLPRGIAPESIPRLSPARDFEAPRLAEALRTALEPFDAGDESLVFIRRLEIDEEHAYGQAQNSLAQALLALGQGEEALAVLDTVERNHGPQPETAYRRGKTLRALGRGPEAKASFSEVGRLAAQAPKFQRGDARAWVFRAWVAGFF